MPNKERFSDYNLIIEIMLNIVLFGAPGAGKGTQAIKLAEKFELIHLSTGDILRKEIEACSALGKQAQNFTDRGEFVPDEVVIGIIHSQMKRHSAARGFIFDGFPRTIAQAEALDKMLEDNNMKISAMIALDVETDELVKRLQLRGKESGRADDMSLDVIQNRIDVYNRKTKPIIDYYSAQNKYTAVCGTGDIDEIFGRLCTHVEKYA